MKRKVGRLLLYSTAIFVAILISIPFVWMVITSFKSSGAIMSIPVEWIPKNPTLDAYRKLFTIPHFPKSILNSFYISIIATIMRLFSAAMAAYALTKIAFKGQEKVFKAYITALMIPVQILFIPLFIVMSRLNLVNSLNAILFLQFFNAFAVFMLRQKMMTINNAYVEAAVIEGANKWQVFMKIILPQCSGTLATLSILAFMDLWNDYLLPLVLLTDKSKYTLPLLLSTLSGQYKNQYNLFMAGSLISVVPILIVFIALQRYFKSGLNVGGIKE